MPTKLLFWIKEELLKLAKEMMEAEQQGNDLGLSNEEKAFYDALTRPQAVKDFYNNNIKGQSDRQVASNLSHLSSYTGLAQGIYQQFNGSIFLIMSFNEASQRFLLKSKPNTILT